MTQSQMSDSELQLLFYNGVGKHGKKYYDLIEEYNFLENITTSGNKGMIEFLENFYPKSSFRL
ncbi:MAG: putative phage abortive infection protein [Bacteroidia bacterium]